MLSNKKSAERRGKVQLINGVHLYRKMRKSLGSKRLELGEEDVALITRTFGQFAAITSYSLDADDADASAKGSKRGRPAARKKADKRSFASKIFASYEFGYRRITIERPLRLSVQFSDERIDELRFASGALNAVMHKVWELYGSNWTAKTYGQLKNVEAELRVLIKVEFAELKEAQIKDLLNPETWAEQKNLLDKATQLQTAVGTDQSNDFNTFEDTLKKALKKTDITLSISERKQLLDAVSWTNPDAEPVIKKILKSPAKPMYGDCEYKGQVVQFQPDSELRDNEDVPLTAETARGAGVDVVNEAYFAKEVAPHVKDAWIDASKCDERDEQIGVIGYEIPFNRYFYEYEAPRDLADIDADMDTLSAEIMAMLHEVHS